jgi:BASS family bile acid:Na+ symporter
MNRASLVQLLTIGGLASIMLSVGMEVTIAEVASAIRKPRLVALGLVANFVLVPAATFGLLYLFDADPMVAVGFLILAVCPGAPVGPPFTAISRGDVACSIGQMVILAGLSAILAPALLSLLLARLLPAGDLEIDSLTIVRTLLVAQILPLAVGVAIHQQAPNIAGRICRPVRMLANLLLLAAIVLVLANEYKTLELIRWRGWFGMLLLLAAGLGIGWLCGGPGQATRKALSVTTGARNAAVALVIVSNNFAGTAAVTAVIAFGLVSILGTLGCALLLAKAGESTGEAVTKTICNQGEHNRL